MIIFTREQIFTPHARSPRARTPPYYILYYMGIIYVPRIDRTHNIAHCCMWNL